MKRYLVVAVLLLCGAGILPAAPAPAPDGAALVARYRQLAGCRMRMKIAYMAGDRVFERATATLLFRRPGNLRVDWDGFREVVQFVRTPREHRAFFPQQQNYRDLNESPVTGPLWNGFANPPRGMAALLEPAPLDRQIIDQVWARTVKSEGTEGADGVEWLRYRARGPGGGRMELWVSPVDHLIRRVVLTQPRYGDDRLEIRIDVDELDRPPGDEAFHLALPARVRNANTPDPGAPQEGPFPPVASLRRRLAARPEDPAAIRALVEALQQYGQNAEALRLMLELVKRHDNAENQALLARCYEQVGANRAAVRTFLKSLAHFGPAARLGNQPGELSRVALNAGLGADVAAALEKHLAGPRGFSPLRAELALLYRGLERYAEAGREYSRLLEPLPARAPDEAAQSDALGQIVGDLPRLAPHLDATARKEIAGRLARIEDRLPEGGGWSMLAAYTALDDLQAAERTAGELGQFYGAGAVALGAVAEASARRGQPEAQRLFREALVAAVEMEPQENMAVAQLVRLEHARAVLAPVFRRLSEMERKELPLQSAHWLYFAGDASAAAQAYAAYLASTAGSPNEATGVERLAARILAARCAREAGDTALADRLLAEAAPDLLLLRADLPDQYPTTMFVRLLVQAASPTARRPLLEQIADSQPDLLLQWSQQGERGWGGMNLPSMKAGEVRPLLQRIARSPALTTGELAMLAQVMQERGLLADAAQITLRLLHGGAGGINAYQVIQLAGQLESNHGEGGPPGGARPDSDEAAPATTPPAGPLASRPDPSGASGRTGSGAAKPKENPLVRQLIAGLQANVQRRKDWEEGEQALAQWYSSHDAPRAVTMLAAIARQRGTPQDYTALAQAELAANRPKEALAHLERALALGPKPRFPVEAQYARALMAAHQRPAAIAAWRRLEGSASTPDEISQIVSSLRSLGREAEAFDFLVARYQTGHVRERYPGEIDQLRQQMVEYYRNKKQFGKLAALYPELRLFDLDVEPDALRHVNLNVPAEVWEALIARLDREHRALAAFNACCVSYGAGAGGDLSRLNRIVDRARKLGQLQLARDALCFIATGSDRPSDDSRAARLPLQYPLAATVWGRLEEEMEHPTVARAIYSRMLHRDGAPLPHAGLGIAEAARRVAGLLEKQGKGDEAARARRWAEALTLLEGASGSEPAKALPALRKAQALFPESPCIQAAICQALPAAERSDARLKTLQLMVPVCGGARDCQYCSALLRHEEGAPPLPAAALLAATHDAGGAYYLIALADTMRENGYDPASQAKRVAAWRTVVTHDPSLLPAWEALRDLGNQSSDTELLIEATQKVAELRRDSAEDWMQAAQALLRVNRRADARKAMEKAHGLDPHFDPADYGLNEVPMMVGGPQPFDDEGNGNEAAMLFQFGSYASLVSGMEPW